MKTIRERFFGKKPKEKKEEVTKVNINNAEILPEKEQEFPKRIAIIGAGLNGLFTAYHIIRICKERNISCPEIVIYDSSEMQASEGESRILRMSTYEHESLPKQVEYSIKILKELADRSNGKFKISDFLTPAQCITTGNNETVIGGAINASNAANVSYHISEGEKLAQEFEKFNLKGFRAVVENPKTDDLPGAAVLNPNKIMKCLRERLKDDGVEFRDHNRVQSIEEDDGNKVVVTDAKNQVEEFDKGVAVTGAWTPKLFPNNKTLQNIHPEIGKLFYFKIIDPEAFEGFPMMILKIKGGKKIKDDHPNFVDDHPELETEGSEANFYLMAEKNKDGEYFLKIGLLQDDPNIEKDPYKAFANFDGEIKPHEKKLVEDFVAEFMPGVVNSLESLNCKTAVAPTSFVPDKLPIISLLHEGSSIIVFYGDNIRGAKTSAGIPEIAALFALGLERLIPRDIKEAFGIDRDSLKPKELKQIPPASVQIKTTKQLEEAPEQQIGA